jgi:hypothetical protein
MQVPVTPEASIMTFTVKGKSIHMFCSSGLPHLHGKEIDAVLIPSHTKYSIRSASTEENVYERHRRTRKSILVNSTNNFLIYAIFSSCTYLCTNKNIVLSTVYIIHK